MTEEDREFESMYRITCRMDELLCQCRDKGDYTLVDTIARKCDTNKLSSGRLLSLLSCMMWAKKHIDYASFYEKCKATFLSRPEDWEDDLLLGLEP